VIVDLGVDFSTPVNETFIKTVMPMILHNLMENGNSITYNGVTYDAAVEEIADGEDIVINGTTIRPDNVTTCTSIILSLHPQHR